MGRALVKTALVLIFTLVFAVACKPDTNELIGKGRAALKDGNHDKAAEFFNEALKNEPENYDALSGLGEVYIEQGKLDEASEQYGKALEAADSEGATKMVNTRLALITLMQAEEMWRKGAYRADRKIEDKIEEKLNQAIDQGDNATKQRGYALLLALFDYQFEENRSAFEKAEGEEKLKHAELELKHIDKVFSQVKPSKEFRQRMRDRVKELTEKTFYQKANATFTEKVVPALKADPNIDVSEERLFVTIALPLSEELLALDLTDPTIKSEAFAPLYKLSKDQTLEIAGQVIAALLGLEKMKNTIQVVSTFKIEKEEIFTDAEDGDIQKLRLTGSLGVEEIKSLAFDYQLYLETEAKVEEQQGKAKDPKKEQTESKKPTPAEGNTEQAKPASDKAPAKDDAAQ